jgi:hypothetical protein
MDVSRYISEIEPISQRISNIRKLRHELGIKTELYLCTILQGQRSAYNLWKYYKENKLADSWSMAYKNVHQKIQKLLELGLIQQERPPIGGNKHGAINYELSTFGLIYVFSQSLFYKYDFCIPQISG